MKLFNLLSIFCVMAFISPLANAEKGGVGGGGGSQIATAFKLRAYSLISKISSIPQANALCSSDIMKNSLDSSFPTVVGSLDPRPYGKVILNPLTHQSYTTVELSKLDALSTPGYIQLLDRDSQPSRQVWRKLLKESSLSQEDQMALDGLVIHEIYRATGTCDDDKKQISPQVIPLLYQTSTIIKYSESFTFVAPFYIYDNYRDNDGHMFTDFAGKGFFYSASQFPLFASLDPQVYFPVTGLSGGGNAVDAGLCEKTSETLKAGDTIACLDISKGVLFNALKVSALNQAPSVYAFNNSPKTPPPVANFIADFLTTTRETEGCSGLLLNQFQFVSPNHPLLVVHDIQTNQWYCAAQ